MGRNNILIFDSGVGGLSVFKEIYRRLPHDNYFYLFDNEAYPYGELSQSILIERTCRLINQMMDEQPIDIVVIACNTASTVVLPHLRSQLSIPVVGVVPAIKPASLISTKAVGLIATPATVSRQYTRDLIRDFAPEKEVVLLGSTRLVEMAEEKLRGFPIDLTELQQVLNSLIGQIDVAVLGCTHFPLLKQEISTVLGDDVVLVDSGSAIAKRVAYLLGEGSIQQEKGELRAFCSAPPFEEEALNQSLKTFSFSPIEHFPLRGV
ncbi:Glutamate racemase [Vibrio hippocampi]|uniref:Glutamate racemase n=2 Tax=Vibrio hippocampi TaxID=654686 RepID=A0ABM8ZDM0_9VIBR|nr:Glutamate racemase [Vibrio hippocampi]